MSEITTQSEVIPVHRYPASAFLDRPVPAPTDQSHAGIRDLVGARAGGQCAHTCVAIMIRHITTSAVTRPTAQTVAVPGAGCSPGGAGGAALLAAAVAGGSPEVRRADAAGVRLALGHRGKP